jgi:NAD(P)H-hydrate epimerase
MENAALKVLRNIDMVYNSFVIVCGSGNNGGDGFALARHLHILGKKVELFLIGKESGLSGDCKINYNIVKNLGVRISYINNMEDINALRESVENCEVTIDAIFGTGLSRNIEGIYGLVIDIVNENSRYTVAVDIPSGLDSDTGKVLGNSVRANKTITFAAYKRGFLNYGSDRFTGEVVVEDIGIPQCVIEKYYEKEIILEEVLIREKLKARNKYSHKGDFGRVLLIAGSKGFTGAAYIAPEAAVKCGAGLVTLGCPEAIQPTLSSKLVEAMTISIEEDEKLKETIVKANAIAIGPGLGNNEKTLELLKYLLKNSVCPVVIDADAINVLEGNLSLLKNKNCKVILTPHHGEMSRITELSTEYILQHRLEAAKDFAKEYEVTLLLKGYNTVITDGNYTFVNPTGSSTMASGGMGDCLTGIITAFLGQKYSPIEAAAIGAYIHGYCGDRLAEDMFSVTASDVLVKLPFAIKDLISN